MLLCLLPVLSVISGWLVIDSASEGVVKDYSGHSLVRVTPSHQSHLDVISSVHETLPGVDVWRSPTLKRSGEVQVPAHLLPDLTQVLTGAGIKHNIVTRDVSQLIGQQMEPVDPNQAEIDPSGFNLTSYHTYEEVLAWLDGLQSTCGKLCSVFDIGTSSEGRALRVIRIGHRTKANTPAVWIDAGIHAREWIAPATAIYLINKLLTGYAADDPITKQLVTKYVWYFLPLANPDGYSFTWTNDRLWRKTRSEHPSSPCKGVDPNRNWNFYWGGRGTSPNPCSDNYHGPYPFSEPETQAMANFLWAMKDQLQVYISLHSYGQYWLTPWGFTYNLPNDYPDMVNQANQATAAMTNSTLYEVGSSSRLLYLASGGSDDWAKGVLRIKYAYTVELHDTGTHGFILPPSYISQVGQEMYKAIQTLAVGVLKERRRYLRQLRRQ